MQDTSVRAADRYAGILFFGLKGKLLDQIAVLICPGSDPYFNHIGAECFVEALLKIIFDHLHPFSIQLTGDLILLLLGSQLGKPCSHGFFLQLLIDSGLQCFLGFGFKSCFSVVSHFIFRSLLPVFHGKLRLLILYPVFH